MPRPEKCAPSSWRGLLLLFPTGQMSATLRNPFSALAHVVGIVIAWFDRTFTNSIDYVIKARLLATAS
jgi:hypothetical protein